jgi:ribosome-binding protein aMBF1 (putative translation factor)
MTMKKHTVPKAFSTSLKAKLHNKSFKEAFEHYSNTLSVGILIRDTRKKAGLTQKEFAHRMGVSQQVVSRLENGEVDNPTIDTLSKIADVAGKKLVVEFV